MYKGSSYLSSVLDAGHSLFEFFVDMTFKMYLPYYPFGCLFSCPLSVNSSVSLYVFNSRPASSVYMPILTAIFRQLLVNGFACHRKLV